MPTLVSSKHAGAGLPLGEMLDRAAFAFGARAKSEGGFDMSSANKVLAFIQQGTRKETMLVVEAELSAAIRSYIERVIATAETLHTLYGGKADHHDLPREIIEGIWNAAMEQESREASFVSRLGVLPALRAAAEKVFRRTAAVLGMEAKPVMVSEAIDKTNISSPLLAGVMETTKANLKGVVSKALAAGLGFRKIVEAVKKAMGRIINNRTSTATRTETRRATDIGTTTAMKHAWEVTHVSVVGCSVIEIHGPCFYMGIPTCNIKNVPAADAGEVEFHINHSGYFEIAGMMNADGTYPDLRLHGG